MKIKSSVVEANPGGPHADGIQLENGHVPFVTLASESANNRSSHRWFQETSTSDYEIHPLAWATSKQGLDVYSSLMLIRLADRSDAFGSAGPASRLELAMLIGSSPRRAFDAIRLLSSLGLITTIRTRAAQGRGPCTRNEYRLNLLVAETQLTARVAELAVRQAPGACRRARISTRASGNGAAALAEQDSLPHQPTSASQAAPDATPVCTVCKYLETTQHGAGPATIELATRLRRDLGLSFDQVQTEVARHDPRHLEAVLVYVTERHRAGKVGQGKAAPYFLATLKNADVESLGFVRAGLDAGRMPARSDIQGVAAKTSATKMAKDRDDTKKGKSMHQAVLDARWHALEKSSQLSLMAQFMSQMAEENGVVYRTLVKPTSDNLKRLLFMSWYSTESLARSPPEES